MESKAKTQEPCERIIYEHFYRDGGNGNDLLSFSGCGLLKTQKYQNQLMYIWLTDTAHLLKDRDSQIKLFKILSNSIHNSEQ